MGNLKKISSVVVSVTTAIWLSGSIMLVPVANAQSVADLQAQITALLAQIQQLQAQLAAAQGAAPAVSCSFTRDLTVGVKGDDVKCLQQYLNASGNKVADSGAGSPGNETTYFGSLTKAAVAKWQAANGVSPAAGYFGSKSRAKYAELAVAVPVQPAQPVQPSAPAVGKKVLTVALAADQPAPGLFGESFSSRPFTKLTFTASADADITVNILTVERTGQGNDAAFSGVIALDEDGVRMGTTKTFGSDHRLKLSDKFTVKAGQTRIITLAGDSDSDQNDYLGQQVSLSLVGLESTADSVTAAYPLTGSLMTVNSTLSIGSVTLERGPSDPGSGPTKEVGTTGYIFSALKMTAGSNEDVLVKSVKWNQSGSAATADLANIKVYLGGVAYDAVVSEDGKYYTAKFGGGVKIDKGGNKEVYIKGDIVSGSNRTVDFDLYRAADLQVSGLTYGYGITPSYTVADDTTDDDGDLQTNNPNFDAYQATIGQGSMTVEKAVSVAAQNIALNLGTQPLGGFVVDVKGEAISVAAMNFDASAVSSAATGVTLDTNDIINVTLYDENGAVVAGPVDGVAGGNNAIRFTDTVTFPVGRHTYTLKGKLSTADSTAWTNNDTVAASTTPSSDWTTVRGVSTGQSVTPGGGTITMSTMTVKSADLVVTLSPDTNASATGQNVVAGTNAYNFTKYILDASGSGEDVRVTQMALRVAIGTANTADDMTNCQLWDSNAALNTGTNVVNPANSDASGDTKTFTLDSGLVIAKGTVKTLALKCNLTAAALASQTYGWGITNATASVVSSGMTSGTSLTETITADNGRTITARASGTVSFTLDSSSPALKWVQAGATDQTLAVFRFDALYEDIRLDTLPLQLATSTAGGADGAGVANASNTPSDLTMVTVWDGSTKVGEAIFSASDFATATLTGVVVPKDAQKLLTVKGDLAAIAIGGAAKPGHLVMVNYDANSSADETNLGAVGVGISSGSTVAAGGSDSATNGARLVKAIPTVTKLSLASQKFSNTTGQSMYRFKVAAPSGGNGLSLYKFTFSVATSISGYLQEMPGDGNVDPEVSDFRVTNFKVYCYDDSGFSSPSCGSWDNSGLLNQGSIADDSTIASALPASNEHLISVTFNPTDSTQGSTAEAIRVPAGGTRYFVLKVDVTGASSTPSIVVKMQGDAQFASLNNSAKLDGRGGACGSDLTCAGDDWDTGRYIFATTAANVNAWDDNDFIWSGNSTNTTQSITSYDWFNGYLVPGLSNSDVGDTETLTLQ
jgi:hypothetical protein